MQSASVLIVDDHPVYRDALHQFLARRFLSFGNQVHSAPSLKEGLKIVKDGQPEWVILLDLIVPDSENQFSGIKEFKKFENVAAIAAISGLENEMLEKQCIEAGCSIFISKSCNSTQIFENLCALMGLRSGQDEFSQLTDRQKEILLHMSSGQSNKMIAYSLNISEQTVKIHLSEIFKKIKVFNRTQAVLKSKENGWT
jgi:DNA-binding NarL/FixJ family response regulator